MSVLTEADTCTRYIVPKLRETGWDEDPHPFREQPTFTDGRIVVIGNKIRRKAKNLNSDLVQQYPNYVARVTADEADIGRQHLSNFQDLEQQTPVTLTTSQLLATGVDAPTCKNVVLARVINSMTEFKQIIGRGTRVREDYGKLFFTILDYTGSATRLFADPDFDGDPALITETEIDVDGRIIDEEDVTPPPIDPPHDGDTDVIVDPLDPDDDDSDGKRRKFYFDGGHVEIDTHLVYELDADGNQLRCVKFTEYATEKVRTMYTSADELRGKWSDPEQRRHIVEQLEKRGIDFDRLAADAGQPEADPFDLLCHLAYNAPLRTRRERAERLRKDKKDFFDRYGPEARKILNALRGKYEQHGTAEFILPDALRVPPLNSFGNAMKIARLFGGAEQLRQAVSELQANLYAARPLEPRSMSIGGSYDQNGD